MSSFGALFIGLGVFELYAGYALAKVGPPVARSDRPFSYWVGVSWAFGFGLFFVIKGLKEYRKDDAKPPVSDDDDAP